MSHPLVDPETREGVGTIRECTLTFELIDNDPEDPADDGFLSTAVLRFDFTGRGEIVSKVVTGGTLPCGDACPDFTHSTILIPGEQEKNIDSQASTGEFEGAMGSVRLSGTADVSEVDVDPLTGFVTGFVTTDCFWEIVLR